MGYQLRKFPAIINKAAVTAGGQAVSACFPTVGASAVLLVIAAASKTAAVTPSIYAFPSFDGTANGVGSQSNKHLVPLTNVAGADDPTATKGAIAILLPPTTTPTPVPFTFISYAVAGGGGNLTGLSVDAWVLYDEVDILTQDASLFEPDPAFPLPATS